MAKVIYELRHNAAKLPERGSEGAAGWDVYAASMRANLEHGYVEYDTGLAVSLPQYYFFDVRARSSLSKHEWVLCNGAGVVDEDYRGTIRLRFRPVNPDISPLIEQPYKVGDRIGQLILQKYFKQEYELEELDTTKRGEGGHGSTGEA